jgi:hypothetical protein
MPLMVTHEYNATTGENNTVIVGLGSTAELVGSQLLACNGRGLVCGVGWA